VQPTGSTGRDRSRPTQEAVVAAFVLGWHVAELFHAGVPRSRRPRQVSLDKLPGVGELDPLARAGLLVAQVRADLERVWRSGGHAQPPPDPTPVQSLLEAESRRGGELRQAILELHRQLLVALTAADAREGKAYGLGRALAETALLADARDPDSFRSQFAPHRLANLLGWLADLESAFPPHAAEAVRQSLQAWAAWVEAPALRPATDRSRPPWTSWFAGRPEEPPVRPVDWGSARDRESVTRALHRQGQLWRSILSGEKDCLDVLSADDYLWAADALLGHIRELTHRFLRRFWAASTALAAVLVAAAVVVSVVHATSAVVVAVVTAAGAVGLTWRGAASGLGKALTQVQRPLWERELDTAVARSVTWLPRERRSTDLPTEPEGSGRDATGAPPEAQRDLPGSSQETPRSGTHTATIDP
jgi:hypothetical protein